jgi:hypothetical protein
VKVKDIKTVGKKQDWVCEMPFFEAQCFPLIVAQTRDLLFVFDVRAGERVAVLPHDKGKCKVEVLAALAGESVLVVVDRTGAPRAKLIEFALN